jgi:hypothetical protein
MAAVVNPGNGQTLEAYRLAAATVEDAIVPEGVFGGRVVAATASGGSLTTSGGSSDGLKGNGAVWVGVLTGGALAVAVML